MNRIIVSLLRRVWLAVLVWPLAARGGDFVDLRPADYPVGDALPRYTTVVPLGRDYAAGGYTVRADYPEYAPLTPAETRRLRRAGITLPDTLEVTTRLGVSRKEGQLDVTVLPFVVRDGRPMRLVSFKLAVDPRSADRARARRTVRSAADRWADSSVLAEGRWVKIRVSEEGIYQLSDAQLSQMGFDRPDRVRLYGYGGRPQPETFDFSSADCPPDDLEEVPLYRREGSLLFFAEGTRRWTLSAGRWTHTNNPYSAYSYYFLTEGEATPATLPTLDAPASSGQTVTHVTAHAVVDNDAYSWFPGGRRFYDSYDFAQGNSRTFNVATPGVVEGEQARVAVRFSAHSSTGSVTVGVALGNATVGTLHIARSDESDLARETESTFTTTALRESNAFRLTTPTGVPARLDYIRISYERQLTAGSTPLVFTTATPGPVTFEISNADTRTRVWRIGQAGDPVAEVAATLDGTTLRAPVSRGDRRYVVFDATATYPAPTVVGTVENQNLHADRDVDMVIIIPASGTLTQPAERLAEAHRSAQGLTVRVVRTDQIFNEFSSGTPDANAYRRYLKMLYDSSSEGREPRYLLLFGDCLWDNRMVTPENRGKNPDDYLLAYESENSLSEIDCYVTDDFFGMLDDGEGANLRTEKMDVAIGRFPCTTESDAQTLVSKAIAYLNNEAAGPWQNLLYFLADDGDGNLHMEGAKRAMDAISGQADDYVIQPVFWDAYPREVTSTSRSYPQVEELLHTAMADGALVMNYTGHGDPNRVSHENVLTLEDFRTNRTTGLPLWVMASCEVTPYDNGEDNMGRAGILNPAGGGIAFICASRTVYANRNEELNMALMPELLARTADGRQQTMGEALMHAKNALVESGADQTSNRIKYALTGDPALPLATPSEGIVVDSVDGRPLADGEKLTWAAGSTVRLSGHVVTDGATPIDDFRGVVSATVFDRAETVTCRNNDGSADEPYVFTQRNKVIFEGSDSVRSGRFSIKFQVPMDISYSTDNGRVALYAVNDSHSLTAHGANEQFCLDGTAPGLADDTEGPDVYVYLNRPDFPDGGLVGPTPVFFAEITDSSGVNTTGNGVGHDLELSLSGTATGNYVLNNYFAYDLGSSTRGRVSYALPELEEGSYRLQFRAWDIMNNPTTVSLNFTVVRDLAPQLSVSATDNPARTSTSFVLTYDRPGTAGTFTVEVFDLTGRRLWTQTAQTTSSTGSVTIPWDLTDTGGAPMNGGVYLFRARLTADGATTETKAQKMIILKQ